MAEDSPARGDARRRSTDPARPPSGADVGLGHHRDDALGDDRVGRGRVAARPLAGDPLLHPGRRDSSASGWPSTWWSSSTGPSSRPPGAAGPPARPRAGSGAGHGRRARRRRDNGDLQRLRARSSVLAAEGEGFEAPTVEEFYPEPLWEFALLGIDFEITRITLILWIATAAMIAFMVAAVRKPSIVPGKLQYIGESGYSLVRDGIARDVVGPKGLPFAPFLAVAVLLHPREQRDVDRAAGADLADVEVRVPAGPRRDHLGHLQLGRHPRAGRGAVLQGRRHPAGRAHRRR